MKKLKNFYFYKFRLRRKYRTLTPPDFQAVNLTMHKSRSNIFITLTDKYSKVITCQTSGSSITSKLKKRKVSPHTIEKIVTNLNKYFIHYKINALQIRLRSKPNVHTFLLFKELTNKGIFIDTVSDCKKLYFTVMRPRKQRRI